MDRKDTINGILISTVRLPFGFGGGDYETCLFDDAANTSEVVNRYDTSSEANAGHEDWCTKVSNGFKIPT